MNHWVVWARTSTLVLPEFNRRKLKIILTFISKKGHNFQSIEERLLQRFIFNFAYWQWQLQTEVLQWELQTVGSFWMLKFLKNFWDFCLCILLYCSALSEQKQKYIPQTMHFVYFYTPSIVELQWLHSKINLMSTHTLGWFLKQLVGIRALNDLQLDRRLIMVLCLFSKDKEKYHLSYNSSSSKKKQKNTTSFCQSLPCSDWSS